VQRIVAVHAGAAGFEARRRRDLVSERRSFARQFRSQKESEDHENTKRRKHEKRPRISDFVFSLFRGFVISVLRAWSEISDWRAKPNGAQTCPLE
jgi:hypothetical protein